MSRFEPAALALLLYALAASGAVAANCRDHAPYSTGTVRISAQFDDCPSQDGFGFIVGERRGKLYAVTAKHVVRCDHDVLPTTPRTAARHIEVSFCEAPDEPPVTPERVVPGPAGLDVALLKLPPSTLPLQWQAPWCDSFKRGDPVWFVGRQRRWYVPLQRDWGAIDDVLPDWKGYFRVSIDSVRAGTSGAPLIGQRGIVGMITDDTGADVTALSIDTIRRFVLRGQHPWGLADCGSVPVAAPKVQPPLEPVPDPIRLSEPPAPPAVRETFRDPLKDGGEGPLMVKVRADCFRMGDIQGGGADDEQPVHEVCFDAPFAIGVHEVTFDDYDRFADATAREKPDHEGWGRGNRPVIRVSWRDANAYADWLSDQTGETYRLPTEAEWEYAARAGTETRYWWGNDIGRNRANCDGCGSRWDGKKTAPVGSFEANDFGLYDTVGNVWEWTCSEYEERYAGRELECASEAEISFPVLRGGSWSLTPSWVRAAARNGYFPVYRDTNWGFRLVRLSRIH